MPWKNLFPLDPVGWAARVVPLPWIYRILDFCVLGIVAVLIYHLAQARPDPTEARAFWPYLWTLEMILYSLFFLVYLFRLPPLQRARGFLSYFIPLIGALAPFLIPCAPFWPGLDVHLSLAYATIALMFVGYIILIVGLASLGRRFGISVEVRGLATGGAYRLARHPIYLGEVLCAGVTSIWRLSAWSIGVWVGFVIVQGIRMRMEEQKLLAVFPREYEDFRRRVGPLWPRLRPIPPREAEPPGTP